VTLLLLTIEKWLRLVLPFPALAIISVLASEPPSPHPHQAPSHILRGHAVGSMVMSTTIESEPTLNKPAKKEKEGYSGSEKHSSELEQGEPHHDLMESYDDHDV